MDDSWETHKAEIENLYMVERKSQAKVMEIMRSTHGFVASKWQYENQFQKWGFKKNHGGSKTWTYIREKNKRRKIENKPDGEVFINGALQSPRSVATGIRRNAYESTIEKHKLAPLPQTPDGVVVRSPAPTCNWELQWPSDLPWFVFSRQVLFHNTFDIKIDRELLNSPQDFRNSPFAPRKNMIHRLGLIPSGFPGNTKGSRSVQSASSIALALKTIMPEEQEGQHDTTAHTLSRRTASSFPEFSLALYMLSNNIRISKTNESLYSLCYDSDESNAIRDILRLSKLDNKQSMKNLLSLKDLTANVLAHRIFKSSIASFDREMVKIMLEAGMDPNTPLETGDYEALIETPLQTISLGPMIKTRDIKPEVVVDIASMLLSHGASTEPINDCASALIWAIYSDNETLFKMLIAYGAKPSTWDLVFAESCHESTRSLHYLQILFDAGVDFPSIILRGRTFLSITRDSRILKWLIEHGCDVNAPQRYTIVPTDSYCPYVHTTSPLGVAASNNNVSFMHVLLNAGANVDSPLESCGYIPPLVLAVHMKAKEAIKLLLASGADFKAADQYKMMYETSGKTLLQRAMPDEEICEYLLLSGAHASSYERQKILALSMMKAAHRGDINMASSLIAFEGPVNPFDDKSKVALLNPSSISSSDSSISSIRDVSTAKYLLSAGWLFEILRLNGPRILASAILQRKNDLVVFLLEQISGQEYILFDRPLGTHTLRETYASPLGSAIYTNNLILAQSLVRYGASVNESDMVMIVCKALESNDETQLLTALGLIPDQQINIPTAFGMAILSNYHSIVQILLRFNFSPQGQPTVIFHTGDKRILAEEMRSRTWDDTGSAWWNRTSRSLNFEVLKLDSVLQIAVENGNQAILQTLLHLNIWTPEQKGRAMRKSIQSKRRDLFQDLLSFGADLNQSIGGYTYRHAEKLSFFPWDSEEFPCLECRCQMLDCSSCRRGRRIYPSMTALTAAMDNDDIQTSNILIDLGCEINTDLGSGYTALYIATLCQSAEFASLLLRNGAVDIDLSHLSELKDRSALKSAVGSKNKELVRSFLTSENLNRVLPLYTGRRGESVMLKAMESGDPELVTLILGAGIGLRHEFQSNQPALPIDSLASALSSESWNDVNMLLSACASVHISSETYGMALQIAARQGNIELVSLLLEKKAAVNQSPSHYAGGTALQYASIKGFIGIARKLLDAGAVIEAPGSVLYGRTAIEGAAECGRTDMLHLLINEGSSPAGPNRRQYIRAVKLAEMNGHIPIARFLKDWVGWTDSDASRYEREVFDEDEKKRLEEEEDNEDEDEDEDGNERLRKPGQHAGYF